MFCKHQWTVLDKVVKPSEFDRVRQSGYRPNTHCDMNNGRTTTVLTCPSCGKVKKVVSKS